MLLYFLIEKSVFFNNFFGELKKSRYLCGDNHSSCNRAVSVTCFTFTVPGMWSSSILRRHKWSAVGLSVRTSLLFLYPNFVCRMAMGTKNAATLIRELRLVAPPRLELSQTEPKSGVLPLHHGAIDFNFAFLRAQRYAIIPTFPNFSGKIFCICAQFVGKCYVCCSKSLGSPYASMTLMT